MHAPTPERRLFISVEELYDNWAKDSEAITAKLERCKRIIESSPKALPPRLTSSSEADHKVCNMLFFMSERFLTTMQTQGIEMVAEECLRQAYADVGRGSASRHAWRLVRPYLLNPGFRSRVEELFCHLAHMEGYDQLGMLELLLEGHEFTLPVSCSKPVKLGEGTTLLDVLEKRDGSPPVTNRWFLSTHKKWIETGFVGGAKVYQEALTRLFDQGKLFDNRVLQLGGYLLDLVGCAIDHLR